MNTHPKVVVSDTITALPAKIEADKKMDDQGYGAYRAKQLSLGYRKYIRDLSYSNTTLVIIDQTRDNFGSAFGGEVVPGGRAPEYYPSVRVHLKKDAKVMNPSGKVIGVWTKFVVTKNKIGPPFREGRFKILFNHGLDDIYSNLYFLSERVLFVSCLCRCLLLIAFSALLLKSLSSRSQSGFRILRFSELFSQHLLDTLGV